MTRGNQRELARAKNAKKQQQMNKSKGADGKSGNNGVSTDKRMERDADIMRLKQQKAKEVEEAKSGQSSSHPKVVKVDPLKEL